MIKQFTLHVEVSDDAEGHADPTFAEVADVLDHLATMYGWHPYAHGFLATRALDARQCGIAMQKEAHKWMRPR